MNPSTTLPEESKPRLPHERDEDTAANTTHHEPEQTGIIEQARRDIEQGQVDTDCRNPHTPDSPCATPNKAK